MPGSADAQSRAAPLPRPPQPTRPTRIVSDPPAKTALGIKDAAAIAADVLMRSRREKFADDGSLTIRSPCHCVRRSVGATLDFGELCRAVSPVFSARQEGETSLAPIPLQGDKGFTRTLRNATMP